MAPARMIYKNLLYLYKESVIISVQNTISGYFNEIYCNDNLASTLCKIIPYGDGGHARIIFEFAEAVDCYGVVIINSNVNSVNVVNFESSIPESEALTIHTVSKQHDYYLTGATPWTSADFAVTFINPTNAPVTFGQIFLLGAAPYTCDRNLLWGHSEPNPFKFISNENLNGEESHVLQYNKLRQRFGFKNITGTQKEIFKTACEHKYVLWDLDGGSTEQMKFGMLDMASDQVKPFIDQWDAGFIFREQPFNQVA